MAIQIKRIYEPVSPDDGARLLVDRLWPRGISKDEAQLDGWVKELAPSRELRTWFGHKAENFQEFAALYQAELDADPAAQAAARRVVSESKGKTVTLLYAAKSPEVNHAVILKAYLESNVEVETGGAREGELPRD